MPQVSITALGSLLLVGTPASAHGACPPLRPSVIAWSSLKVVWVASERCRVSMQILEEGPNGPTRPQRIELMARPKWGRVEIAGDMLTYDAGDRFPATVTFAVTINPESVSPERTAVLAIEADSSDQGAR